MIVADGGKMTILAAAEGSSARPPASPPVALALRSSGISLAAAPSANVRLGPWLMLTLLTPSYLLTRW